MNCAQGPLARKLPETQSLGIPSLQLVAYIIRKQIADDHARCLFNLFAVFVLIIRTQSVFDVVVDDVVQFLSGETIIVSENRVDLIDYLF